MSLGLIVAGINVIGGLAMKGFDVYNNYKRNSAMSNAMEVLIENDRRLHDCLIRVEDNVGLVARTMATGFKQVNDGFNRLNSSLLHTLFRVDSMMNTTEQRFRDTHDTLNNYHLAIHYLGKALAVVLPLSTRYKNMLQEYKLIVKGFIDGLDKISTGRLSFEILDPIQLSQYLHTIETDLKQGNSGYTLAFKHMYQYYAVPMVSFANSPDYLILQIPMFLRYKFQPLRSLFLHQYSTCTL